MSTWMRVGNANGVSDSVEATIACGVDWYLEGESACRWNSGDNRKEVQKTLREREGQRKKKHIVNRAHGQVRSAMRL